MTQPVVKRESLMVPRLDVANLIEKAIASNVGVETMERLLAIAKEVRAEAARAAWHEAMAAFQAEAPAVPKTKTANVVSRMGGRWSYKYAPLEAMVDVYRPILAKYGLSAIFETVCTDKQVMARCLVMHADGHVQQCEFTVPVDLDSRMNPAQQIGSASTYARRYAYMAALGLAPEDDDDGASAGDVVEPAPRPVVQAASRVAEPMEDTSAAPPREEPPDWVQPTTKLADKVKISAGQAKRFWAIAYSNNWNNAQVSAMLTSFGFRDTADIPRSKYEEVIALLERGPQAAGA